MEEFELYCYVKYIMVDSGVTPQLRQEHTVDPKDPSKAEAHLVWEIESREEFLLKVCWAWSGHPAAPTLVVASRNRVSFSRSEKGTHTELFWSHMGQKGHIWPLSLQPVWDKSVRSHWQKVTISSPREGPCLFSLQFDDLLRFLWEEHAMLNYCRE